MVIVGASSMDGLPVDDGTYLLQISGFGYLQVLFFYLTFSL